MEKINQHNYEAFYLDYLEGNLGEIEQTMLFNFLDDNLDLKAELEDDILDYTLSSNTDKLTTFEKEDLKHFECLTDEICLNNVNDFIIADLENDISSEKKKELDGFIIEHKLEETKNYFHATKLIPNLTEVYDDKAGLKKKGRIIPLFIKIVSVAAVGVLLFNFIGSTNSEYYSVRQSNFALQIDTLNHKFEINLANNNSDKIVELNTNLPEKNKLNPIDNLPHFAEVKVDSVQSIIENLPNLKNDIAIENIKPIDKDSSVTPLIIEHPKFDDDIVQTKDPKETQDNGIKLIDMYKPITNLTNSYTSLNVSYKKSTKESTYQVTNIKLGKFSFERKRKK